jgi:hypothetical protein
MSAPGPFGQSPPTTDDESDEEPIQPDTSYRDLTTKVKLNAKVQSIIALKSRAVVDSAKVYVVSSEKTRTGPLTDPTDRVKRKRVEEIHTALNDKTKTRKILDDHFGSMPVDTTKKKVKSGQKVTLKAIGEQVPKLVLGEDGEGARPYGHQKGMLTLEPDRVHALRPKVKVGGLVKQYLGHISELFFAKVQGMEVECMLVNDRVLVSVNDSDLVKQVAALTLQTLLKEAEQEVATSEDVHNRRRHDVGVMGGALSVADGVDPTKTQLEGATRLSEAAIGFHMDHDSREGLESFLGMLQEQARSALQVQGPFSIDEAATKITDPTFENAVIAVGTLKNDSHAEQHLALALVKSGYRGKATVAGTKNPCTVCWLTLALVQQAGFDLDFNNNPGALWGTTYRGLSAVAEALNVTDITNLAKRLRKTVDLLPDQEFTQFLTALKEGTNLTIKVPTTGGGLKEKGYTQDITPRSPPFVDNDDRVWMGEETEIPTTPERGTYGTPQQSQEEDD